MSCSATGRWENYRDGQRSLNKAATAMIAEQQNTRYVPGAIKLQQELIGIMYSAYWEESKKLYRPQRIESRTTECHQTPLTMCEKKQRTFFSLPSFPFMNSSWSYPNLKPNPYPNSDSNPICPTNSTYSQSKEAFSTAASSNGERQGTGPGETSCFSS